MKEFYNSFTFILTFFLLAILIEMGFGKKALEGFLTLVFVSMLVYNADIFTRIAQGLSGPQEVKKE